MTNEEKELLLKDLAARLPYGVKVQVCNLKEHTPTVKGLLNDELYVQFDYITKPIKNGDSTYNIINDNVKPYLRPMSSMTEEEKKEFKEQFGFELDIDENWGHSLLWNTGSSDGYIDVEFELDNIDLVSVWLDEKMFDWRRIKKDNKRISMIKAGLAIEAPKGIYN